MPLVAVQLWVSTWWRTFGLPFALNIILTIPTAAVAVAHSTRFGPVYPWAQPMLAMLPGRHQHFLNVTPKIATTIVVSALIVIGVGWSHLLSPGCDCMNVVTKIERGQPYTLLFLLRPRDRSVSQDHWVEGCISLLTPVHGGGEMDVETFLVILFVVLSFSANWWFRRLTQRLEKRLSHLSDCHVQPPHGFQCPQEKGRYSA